MRIAITGGIGTIEPAVIVRGVAHGHSFFNIDVDAPHHGTAGWAHKSRRSFDSAGRSFK